ncbi:MAG: hypothetical protein HOC71_13340 [Candidatus Latescibacteria bacterium]|jgi:hypothetical protein|nr:hypothetical protein [Candidatus Latescibacterota bacterium]
MDDAVIITEFEKLARRLGIVIRYNIDGPSGLCTVKGERLMFIDRTLNRNVKIDLYVREFKTLDLEGIFVVPIIRRLLGLENDTSEW